MNEYTERKMTALIGMMKHTNLTKNDILCICGSLESEQAADEIVDLLRNNKERLKEISEQQMFSMCVYILIKNQEFQIRTGDTFSPLAPKDKEKIKQHLSQRAGEYFMFMDD